MTTGKNIALTRRTLAGKVMSLLFNMQKQDNFNEKLTWESSHCFLAVVRSTRDGFMAPSPWAVGSATVDLSDSFTVGSVVSYC